MAELFLAQDTEREELVVIKRILPYLSHEAEFVQMFLDEARIAAQLHHDNIIQVFDLGLQQESIFIAMEFVEGVDLRKIFQEEAKRAQLMPYEAMAHVTAQVCDGLAYAHTARGVDGRPLEIIHRDVSPQNVMVSFDGAIKLVDFGIAKAGALVERSKPGVIKGKFLYLSPEQLSQERLDHRADLFALGTMMYELTTGKAPFHRSTTEAVIYAIRNEEPVPPQQARPGFPPELSRIILKCLVKDRNRRYQSAAEVRRDLEAFVAKFRPFGQLELSSYVGQLFGTEDERTMLHIPKASMPPLDLGAGRLPVGKRQTSVQDLPASGEEPPSRAERPALPRPTLSLPPARRQSGVRYADAGETSEQTHTTQSSVGGQPEPPPGDAIDETLDPSFEGSQPSRGPTDPGDPVFDFTPARARSMPGAPPTDPTQPFPKRGRAPVDPLDEEEPIRLPPSRARSFLVFALAFTLVLGLGLLGLWLFRFISDSGTEPAHAQEGTGGKPGPPSGGDVAPPPLDAGEASAGTAPEAPDASVAESSATGAPDASVAESGTPGTPDVPVPTVPVVFRAPRGTIVLHERQRLSLGEAHDLPPGLFEYSYQCPGKRLLIPGSVRVASQGNRPQVVTLGCRPRR